MTPRKQILYHLWRCHRTPVWYIIWSQKPKTILTINISLQIELFNDMPGNLYLTIRDDLRHSDMSFDQH